MVQKAFTSAVVTTTWENYSSRKETSIKPGASIRKLFKFGKNLSFRKIYRMLKTTTTPIMMTISYMKKHMNI